VIRYLHHNNFTGPILASITALTRLAHLYAPLPPCDLPADSGVRKSTLWHRAVDGNRFSGSVPSTISAMTKLTQLCVPKFQSMRRLPRCASAWALPLVRPHSSLCVIRWLDNNNFTGPILASITALTRLVSLYALLPLCDLPADSGVRMSSLRHRALGRNRFSGSMPSTISALTALTTMCVPEFLPMRRAGACLAARARGRFVRFGRTPHCA
jgi:hypothetical protein